MGLTHVQLTYSLGTLPGCRQCRTGTGVLAFGRALPCPVQASDGLRPALPCPVTAFGRRTGFQSQCSVALSASWVRIMSLLSLCRHRCLQRSLQSPCRRRHNDETDHLSDAWSMYHVEAAIAASNERCSPMPPRATMIMMRRTISI